MDKEPIRVELKNPARGGVAVGGYGLEAPPGGAGRAAAVSSDYVVPVSIAGTYPNNVIFDKHRIMSTMNNGTTAEFTTQGVHGLNPGDHVDVSDTSGGGYDGTNKVVAATPSAWSFTLTGVPFVAPSYFGTWTPHVTGTEELPAEAPAADEVRKW